MTNKEWLFGCPNTEIVRTLQGCPPGKPCIRQKCESSICEECWAKWLDAKHEEPLKPCPFCGGKEFSASMKSCLTEATIDFKCQTCGMQFIMDVPIDEKNKFDYKKIWNRRSNDE